MAQERKRPLGQARTWLVAIGLSIVCLAAIAPAAMALPSGFWGVSPQAAPSVEQFQRLRAGGVESVRIPISWSASQPLSGAEANFAASDQLVAGAAAAGLNVLPFVYDAPSWAVTQARVPHSRATAPKTLPVKTGAQRSAWANFLELAVQRYGPSGSFWAANPSIPASPIRTWQIWNEPNFKYFVDAAQPVRLRQAGQHLLLGDQKRRPGGEADPRRSVRAAGRSQIQEKATGSLLTQLTSSIRCTASHRASRPSSPASPCIRTPRSTSSSHPRSKKSALFSRRVMMPNKKLWITEIGWSSEPPSRRVTPSPKARLARQRS